LLGSERLALWRRGSSIPLNVEDTLSQLITRLHDTPTPLSLDQSDQLMRMLPAREQFILLASATMQPFLDDATFATVKSKAVNILTPPQYQIFDEFLTAQQARVELGRPRNNAKKTPPPSGVSPTR
jgi:hypothetical protein